MKILLKYWYIILLAILLSVGAAAGILYLRKPEWMPPPVDPLAEERELAPIADMSDDYVKWNFEIVQLEDLREELSKEREVIEREQQELEALQVQVDQEIAEMTELRDEINQLQESVRKEFECIEVSEEANLKNLAKVYSAMKPAPIVRLFQEMEEELVVKIMSAMQAETAAGILEEMSQDGNNRQIIERAVRITDQLRKLQK